MRELENKEEDCLNLISLTDLGSVWVPVIQGVDPKMFRSRKVDWLKFVRNV